MIDQYLILSIPRLLKRHWTALGGAIAKDVPYEIIRFKKGIEARDYKTMTEVAMAAHEDGFPIFHQFALGKQENNSQQSKQNIALFWGWAKALKYIAESGLTTLLTWDDRIPSVKFSVLQEIMKFLYAQPDNFLIWQLRIRTLPENLPLICTEDEIKEILPDDIGKTRADFINTIEGFDIQNINFAMPSGETINLNPKEVIEKRDYAHYIRKGLLGYDETMVLSPAGASWLFSQILNMENRIEDLHTFEFPDVPDGFYTEETLVPTMRSRINNDNWLHWELNPIANEASKNNHGIYTSRKMGYDFVYEPFNFNTTVFWSPREPEEVDVLPAVRIKFVEDEVLEPFGLADEDNLMLL